MKNIIILIITYISLSATNIVTPPTIPTLKSKKQNSCKLIPPMLVNLPPMLENDLIKCKNQLYKPTKKFAEKRLSTLLKRKTTIINIKIARNYAILYKIKTYKNTYYCNKDISSCFIIKKILGK